MRSNAALNPSLAHTAMTKVGGTQRATGKARHCACLNFRRCFKKVPLELDTEPVQAVARAVACASEECVFVPLLSKSKTVHRPRRFKPSGSSFRQSPRDLPSSSRCACLPRTLLRRGQNCLVSFSWLSLEGLISQRIVGSETPFTQRWSFFLPELQEIPTA